MRLRRPTSAAVAVFALLATGACGVLRGTEADAVWVLAPDQDLTAETTRVTVLVMRLGCNSGVTGEVQEPDIDLRDDEVALTFSVRPGPPDSATCPGNDPVRYDVVLPEPLGQRDLVDGRCAEGQEAAGTTFCVP